MSTTQEAPIHEDLGHLVQENLIREQTEQLTSVITSPGFISVLEELHATPEAERRQRAAELASVEELERRGVVAPEGLRFTTRRFEDPADGVLSAGDLKLQRGDIDPRMGVCASVGWIVCVSYGN